VNKKTRRGFTLPEVLMATVLSMMVFFALGTLLTRSFSIWYSGMAQWKLATHARIARLRLLDGGFGRGTGVLSGSDHTVNPYGSWEYVQYSPGGSEKEFKIYGRISDTARENMWLDNDDGAWAYGQSVKNLGNEDPDVKVGGFDAEINADDGILEVTYTLHLSAGGKEFEQPQTIRVVLLNSE